FSSGRRHTRWPRDWSSDVCSSDLSVMQQTKNPQRVQAAQMAQVQSWSLELKQGLAEYQARQAALAAAQAVANAIAARNNHPGPQIGRAAGRERVWMGGADGAYNRK